MDDLAEQKKQLEEKIVEMIIKAEEEKKITEDDMATIAQFVLDGIDAAQTEDALKGFLRELAKRWEFFKPLSILAEVEEQKRIEEEVTQGVMVLLQHGKIENATKLAQSITNKSEPEQQK